MGVVVPVVFLVFFGFLTITFFKKLKKFHNLNIPSPDEFPLAIEIFYPTWKLAMMSAEGRFETFAKYCYKFTDMMKLMFGPKITIFVNNADRIQKVLMSQKCLEKWNLFYGLMDRDTGLISASAKKKWKEHRKFFNFSFTLKILESFTTIFIEHTKNLCEKLEKEAENGKEFDFSVQAKRISFDILCATSLGTDDLKNDETYERIFEAYET